MTVVGGGLYSISGNLLTRIAGTGSNEIRNPIALQQLEGVAYAGTNGVVVVVGEPNEYGMYFYRN